MTIADLMSDISHDNADTISTSCVKTHPQTRATLQLFAVSQAYHFKFIFTWIANSDRKYKSTTVLSIR
jgi:hypothetical protein